MCGLGFQNASLYYVLEMKTKNIPWALGAKKIKESALFRCQKSFPF
jgi:hypothetical protein